VQTPGGTGALRVAADFLKEKFNAPAVWLSDPTWANHPAIFEAAGVPTRTYPYYDAASHSLAFDAMCETLRRVPAGDVVLLHGCCHNPTGMDPDPAQWQTIAGIAREAGWLPMVDFAYQGFGDGLDEDAAGVRAVADTGLEALICASYSKNFGLYRERVGALLALAGNGDDAGKVLGHLKRTVRRNYSNPPAHGGLIVATIVADVDLRARWRQEVAAMRDRINGMRRLFVDTLAAKGVTQDFSFLTSQRGMFSFSGLTRDEVAVLRDEYAIYIVGSGRINVAGMTEANMDRLCTCIAEVLARR
jgi:aspartate/tyrosine/aromatic aminotransferase